jgi:hypothetical protein
MPREAVARRPGPKSLTPEGVSYMNPFEKKSVDSGMRNFPRLL